MFKINFLPVKITLLLFQTLIFSCITVSAFAQNSNSSLSLDEAVKIAFSTDKKVMAAQANYQAAGTGIKQAKASFMPSLALKGNYSYLSRVSEFEILSEVIKIVSDTTVNTNIGLNYDLYTFGRRSAVLQIARTTAQRFKLQRRHSKKNLFDRVARAYFTVVYTKKSLALIKHEKERFERIHNLIENRFKQDLVSEFDLLQSQLRLEKHKLAQLEISNVVRTAKINLAKMLDLSVDNLPELSDSLSKKILKLSGVSGREMMLDNREDYLEATLSYQTAKLNRKLTRSFWFPTLSAYAAYDWRNNYQPDVDKIEGSYMFGVNFGWLLFDGFTRNAEISKHEYLSKSYNYLVDDLKLEIPNQIKSVELALENYAMRIEVAEQALIVARKAMAIAETRFELGDISMIDLLEAENNLSQAELELIELQYGNLLVQLDFKKVCGYYPEIEDF